MCKIINLCNGRTEACFAGYGHENEEISYCAKIIKLNYQENNVIER
jgi:hypothetical protein